MTSYYLLSVTVEEGDLLSIGHHHKVEVVQVESLTTLLVPTNSVIMLEGNKGFVYVVEKGRLEERTVDLGIQKKENVEIVNGITEEEFLVKYPSNELKDGDHLVMPITHFQRPMSHVKDIKKKDIASTIIKAIVKN